MTEEFKKARDEFVEKQLTFMNKEYTKKGADWAYNWCIVNLNFENQDDIKSLMNKVLRYKKALDLALYYIEGDATWEGVKHQVDQILNGTNGTEDVNSTQK